MKNFKRYDVTIMTSSSHVMS